jgi:hypothetical protein
MRIRKGNHEVFRLKYGLTCDLAAVDTSLIGFNGQNNPEALVCQRFTFVQTILGSTNGPSLSALIN